MRIKCFVGPYLKNLIKRSETIALDYDIKGYKLKYVNYKWWLTPIYKEV